MVLEDHSPHSIQVLHPRKSDHYRRNLVFGNVPDAEHLSIQRLHGWAVAKFQRLVLCSGEQSYSQGRTVLLPIGKHAECFWGFRDDGLARTLSQD